MKLRSVVLVVLLLALVGYSCQMTAQEAMDACGEYKTSTNPDDCGGEAGCAKCSCTGGRISRGYRNAKQIQESRGDSTEPSVAPFCVSIWAWLAPVLAVVVIGGGIGAFLFMRKKGNTTPQQ